MREVLAELTQKEKPFYILGYLIWPFFVVCLITGIFLLVYYVPTFTQAFSSVRSIEEQIPFGWLMRRLHGVSAGFLLLLTFFHLIKIFYKGNYKNSPRTFWVLKVAVLFSLIFSNFSGYFLPLSQEAFWGTASTLANLTNIPGGGSYLVNFLKGGQELGGVALSRFFSLHIALAAAIGFSLFYLGKREKEKGTREKPSLTGWTLGIIFVVWGLFCYFVTWGPAWFVDELREPAQPLLTPRFWPHPWYFWGFPETIPFVSYAYPFLSFSLFWGFIILIFSLPYLDRGPEKDILQRPVALALGSAFLVAVGYFTFLGLSGSKYSDMVVLPSAPQSVAEIRGARIYAEKNCAFCHQINGNYGRREGPDMLVVGERKRSPEWVQRYIWNASLFQPRTTMPRYDLPLSDLEALSAYLLALPREKKNWQVIPRPLFGELGEQVWQAGKEEK
ncbi:MAG: cytochrome b N-terminal domain-containing protein [Thermodesulfobacteriota bacterium]